MKFVESMVESCYEWSGDRGEGWGVFVVKKVGEEMCEVCDVFDGIVCWEGLNGEVGDVIMCGIEVV